MNYETFRNIIIVVTVCGVLLLTILFGPIGLMIGLIGAASGYYGWQREGRKIEEEESRRYEEESDYIKQLEEENKKLRKEKYGDKYK